MKDEILYLIYNKKNLFNKELNDSIRRLENIKAEIKNNPGEKAIGLTINDLPLIMTKVVSSKTVLQALMELETEIIGLGE